MRNQHNEQKGLLRAAAYCRFSSDMQREESIDAQLRAIRSYAEANGMVIVREYCDRAKSATTDQRPEFMAMIGDAGEDIYDVLIVHKLDRFSRSRYDSAHYRHKLKQNGVQFRSVTENLDGSPESIVLESLLEGMAEYYSKNLAREVMKGLKENARKGLSTGGRAPLGYDIDPDTRKLVVNEHEAQAVRLIFRRTVEGVGYGEIIDELARLGYRTKEGNPIGKNTLHGLLKNRKYVGDYIFNKSSEKDCDGKRNGHKYKPEEEWIVIPDAVPALVSREDFEIVQKKLSMRKHTKDPHNAKEVYLLKGKMFCGCCGGAYIGARRQRGKQSGTYFVHYGCGTRFRAREAGCTNKQISKPFIEKFVIENLAEYVFNREYVSIITKEYNDYLRGQNRELNSGLHTVQSQLAKVKRDLSKIAELLIQTQAPTLIERLEGLEKEKVQLESRLHQMERTAATVQVSEEEVSALFAQIRKQFLSGELRNLKQIIDAYVHRVEVHPETVTVYFNFFPKISIATSMEKPEGCECSQPSGSLGQRLVQDVVNNGGEGAQNDQGRKIKKVKAHNVQCDDTTKLPVDRACTVWQDGYSKVYWVNPLMIWTSRTNIKRLYDTIGNWRSWLDVR